MAVQSLLHAAVGYALRMGVGRDAVKMAA